MSEVAEEIRATHPYSFRSGEWARLLTTVQSPVRDCYVVQFDDGETDFWVVGDDDAGYEFRSSLLHGGERERELDPTEGGADGAG